MVTHRRREATTAVPGVQGSGWLASVDAELGAWRRRQARVLRARGGASRESSIVVGQVGAYEERETREARPVRVQAPLPWVAAPTRRYAQGERLRIVGVWHVRSLLESWHWATSVAPWYESRARALERGVERAVVACCSRVVLLACSACRGECAHERREVPVYCGHRLCSRCCARYYGRTRKRMVKAAGARMREAAREPFRRPHVEPCGACGKSHPRHPEVRRTGRRKAFVHGNSRCQLWTLSVAHQRTAGETRGLIVEGWVRLRAWLQKLLGRSLPFALVWEHTDGEDGKPHVHAHVLIVAPPLCWKLLSEEWQRATEGHGGGIGHARKGTDPRRGIVSSTAAARYMAKYASKGSEADGGAPGLAAEVFAASYMQRRVSTSRGWWVREAWRHSPCCGAPWALVAIAPARDSAYGAPDGQEHALRTPPCAKPPS